MITYEKDNEIHTLSSKGKTETQGEKTGLGGGGGKQTNENKQTNNLMRKLSQVWRLQTPRTVNAALAASPPQALCSVFYVWNLQFLLPCLSTWKCICVCVSLLAECVSSSQILSTLSPTRMQLGLAALALQVCLAGIMQAFLKYSSVQLPYPAYSSHKERRLDFFPCREGHVWLRECRPQAPAFMIRAPLSDLEEVGEELP